jgi:hypothetical protein
VGFRFELFSTLPGRGFGVSSENRFSEDNGRRTRGLCGGAGGARMGGENKKERAAAATSRRDMSCVKEAYSGSKESLVWA